MPVGLERLITVADKEKQKKEREYINKRTDALIKYREELYKKDRQREKDNVKEVMEGLNVSKAEAEKIVRDTIFDGKRRQSEIIDFGTEEEQKERSKKLKRQKNLKRGKEVNKGGLLKMKSGGKVYSRGSRKANYNG